MCRLPFYLFLSLIFLLLFSSPVTLFLSYQYCCKQVECAYQWLSCAQSPRWALHRIVIIKASTFCPSEDIFAMTPAHRLSDKVQACFYMHWGFSVWRWGAAETSALFAVMLHLWGRSDSFLQQYHDTFLLLHCLSNVISLYRWNWQSHSCSCGLRLSLVPVLAIEVSKLGNAYPMPLLQDSSSGLCIHSKVPGMVDNLHWFFL